MLSSVWRGMRAAKASRCSRPSSGAAAASGNWQASSVAKPASPSTWSPPGASTIWHPRVAALRRTAMQKERYRLQDLRIGALPILNRFIARMGLEEELGLAVRNAGYADALLALMKNILVDRNALYAIPEWAALFDTGLISQGKINDDKLARALDRLFAADRATLQTRIVLAVMNSFDLKMEQIHNDTTSVMVRGAYDGQNPKAVQLKRGHSKEHRPDLKQLIYSLCVTSDGAVPGHVKAYDGNQTDDGIHLETWNRL